MVQDQTIRIEQDLDQITDMLLLNGALTECPGLVHGKIGIAVFFFHYAQHTGDELFADYAMDLIGEMMHQLHVNSPADYERGLAGISVGFDYLIRNNFLNVEDDICEDFDARMYRAVMYDPWQDFNQYCGLTGYGRYWMTRLRYQVPSVQARECLLRIAALIEERLPDISEHEQSDVCCFLHDLSTNYTNLHGKFGSAKELLEQCRRQWDVQSLDFPRLVGSAVGNIARLYHRSRYFNDVLQNEMDNALKQIPALDLKKAPASTGLLNGYTGEGMLRLTALNPTNLSWVYLL